jgi:hypothetical protein
LEKNPIIIIKKEKKIDGETKKNSRVESSPSTSLMPGETPKVPDTKDKYSSKY